MIFRQVIHDDLGCASYFVGDEDAGVAAVVDPKFEIEEYVALARYLGVRIEHILETHNHADHVSGHGRLAAATGAVIHIHRDAAPGYDHQALHDGWELELGALRIRALHTPGHRPEHTAFLLTDTARGDEAPWALLSGDTMFVGDVARPDLAIDEQDGARDIFRSLHRLLSLAGEVEVWPGHLGGSMCGGPGMDLKVSSTIGFERAHNDVLRIGEEDAFVERLLSTLGPQPPNFQDIIAINRGPLLAASVAAHPLAPRQVRQQQDAGALLVDVRTDLQFDEAHIPGALCITVLRAGFGSKLAWLSDPEQRVVFIGRDDADGERGAELAAAVGIRKIAGHLHGGMTAWREEQRSVARTERLSVPALHQRWQSDPGALQVLDVRERGEWERGHIPAAVHVPYHDLRAVPEALDPNGPIAVICASGQRAAVGASVLQRHGARQVIHVVEGGVPLWQRRGWAIE